MNGGHAGSGCEAVIFAALLAGADEPLQPDGAKEKSPAFQRWEQTPSAVESRQGRQKHRIVPRFLRPFGTRLAFGLVSQR